MKISSIISGKRVETISASASLADEKIAVIREGKTTHWMRSTIITQAIHHATEHRAQAVCALEVKGFRAVNLDDYDVWAYEINNG